MVVPDEIRRYVPVEVSAKGLPIIQWEKDQTEAAGLVKIDILGNRSLAVIRDALAAVKKNTGQRDRLRLLAAAGGRDGPAQLLRSGETMGCFYIEIPATRQLLKRCGSATRGDGVRSLRAPGHGLLHHPPGGQRLHPRVRRPHAGEALALPASAAGRGPRRDLRHRHLPGADHPDGHGPGRLLRLRGGPAAQDHQQEAQGEEAGGLSGRSSSPEGTQRAFPRRSCRRSGTRSSPSPATPSASPIRPPTPW